MAIINFNQVIKDVDGITPVPCEVDIDQCPNCGMKNGKVEPRGELTLKICTTRALNFNFEDERGLSGDRKAERGLLSMRIWSAPESIDLESNEIDLIRQLVDKLYGPIVIARTRAMLSIKEKPKDGK